jgi:glycosyltransferase involved in cell wall biosynthesis
LSHRSVNRARLVPCGFQDVEQLDALLEYANAVLLPITIGEGSNLKTAEALVSTLPIVATTKAFRGFEHFGNSPGVYIADTADEFQAVTRSLMSNLRPEPYRRPGTESLLWPASMKPFIEAVHYAAGQS